MSRLAPFRLASSLIPRRSSALHTIMPASSMTPATAAPAHDFVSFVNASPTPYHAVDSVKSRLDKAGFQNVKERDSWSSSVKPGGKYYTTRNGSSIVAFAVGNQWRPGSPFAMIGAHTDSCCLKVKAVSKKQADGYLQVGVELYGGGLWHTWFDRDLSLAGRIIVRTKTGRLEPRLVNFVRPILRVPSLAIHLDRQEPFTFDKEAQLFPIAGLVAAELDRQGGAKRSEEDPDVDKNATFAPLKALTERHHPYIVQMAAEKAGVNVDDIVDIELSAYDTHKSCIGGMNEEFIFSARLDNLGSCYCATEALTGSLKEPAALASDNTVRVMSLFDHEEVGSLSAQGADSNLLPAVLTRLSGLPLSVFEAQGSDDSYDKVNDETTAVLEQSLATSFLLSADMTHSVNPNYSGKYEPDAKPEMNKGPVVKHNANQRYMTNSPGYVLVQEVARQAGVPLQNFFIKNGSPCGSTIGPMLAGKLGSRTLDMGNPQLSMHSIRETSGVYDVGYAIKLFEGFWATYGAMERQIVID